MLLLQQTLSPDVANVAFDEALLEHADQNESHAEVLRLWTPQAPMVVIGRSSPWQLEVNHDFCSQQNIPVVRRCSGGQSIVTGPGCLMYAVLLDYRKRPELRMLDRAHQFVIDKVRSGLSAVGVASQIQGTSDLTVDGRKVSGNSMRCKKNWFIYHGTMICDLDIQLIADCLSTPVRQPDYRQQRGHREFLAQISSTPEKLAAAMAAAWSAIDPFEIPDGLLDTTSQLLKSKYQTKDWNRKV